MPHVRRAIIVLACVLLISGCSDPLATRPEPFIDDYGARQTLLPTTAPPADEVRSARGNVTKSVGEPFGLEGGSGPLATFTITAIDVDPSCAAADRGVDTHHLLIDIEGTTSASLPRSLDFGENAWFFVAEETAEAVPVTGVDAPVSCAGDAGAFPEVMSAGDSAEGAVILEVPAATGIVVLQVAPGFSWEWGF